MRCWWVPAWRRQLVYPRVGLSPETLSGGWLRLMTTARVILNLSSEQTPTIQNSWKCSVQHRPNVGRFSTDTSNLTKMIVPGV